MSGSPAGQWSIFEAASDFSGQPTLHHRSKHAVPADWLPSADVVLFTDIGEQVPGGGIWSLQLSPERKLTKLMDTAAAERHPRVSPDGNWIAYTAEGSSTREVFVQSFPEFGAKYQVSVNGGGEPVWSSDGSELFFRQDQDVLVAAIELEPFRAGNPQILFSGDYDSAPLTGHQHYDVANDDERFLMITHGEPDGPDELVVVLHWSSALDRSR